VAGGHGAKIITQRGGAMSEREEVTIRRYDACEMDYVAERESGDYVKYEDHMAALTTAERERDEARREREEAKQTLRGYIDGSRRAVKSMTTNAHTWLDNLNAEKHDDLDVRFASALSFVEALRQRAEAAERVAKSAARLNAAWYIASVMDDGLGLPPLLRCVPEIRSVCESARTYEALRALTPTTPEAQS
jgi:hypothetical protein